MVNLRLMSEQDVAFANRLREIAGWNQTGRDWRGYLSYDPDGCFVAEVEGKPAGTATTIAQNGSNCNNGTPKTPKWSSTYGACPTGVTFP